MSIREISPDVRAGLDSFIEGMVQRGEVRPLIHSDYGNIGTGFEIDRLGPVVIFSEWLFSPIAVEVHKVSGSKPVFKYLESHEALPAKRRVARRAKEN